MMLTWLRVLFICVSGLVPSVLAGWGVGVQEVWKGICYTPRVSKDEGLEFTQDDFMTEAAKPMWGSYGRGDLLTIKALGANRVRMYGNSPDNDHAGFLDSALEIGLEVIAGISNWPYIQMPNNCKSTGGDCYDAIEEAYTGNLLKGFVLANRTYHPALSHMVVMNEPDLQLGTDVGNVTFESGFRDPKAWVKGVISAIDGIIAAEKDMNITGDLIGLTVTMTFAQCHMCIGQDPTGKASKPGLGQMLELKNGLLHPDQYGYVPKNNLSDVYYTRLLNSLNTQNPADEVIPQFLDPYEVAFPDTAVMFQEYHSFWQWGYEAHKKDLQQMLNRAATSKLLLGINFFEFQVSWQKFSAKDNYTNFVELLFGMFGLGTYKLADLNYYTTWTPLMCLEEVAFDHVGDNKTCNGVECFLPTNNISQAVTDAYGGAGVDDLALCRPDASKVPLTAVGYMLVKSSPGCEHNMVTFVQRLVLHIGGMAPPNVGLNAFCRQYCAGIIWEPSVVQDTSLQVVDASDETVYAELIAALRDNPSWSYWSLDQSTCVSDRRSDMYAVGRTIGLLCNEKLSYFDCVNVPWHCKANTWLTADYVFSTYYSELEATGNPNPMEDCYFNGTAMHSSATYQYENELDMACIVSTDPEMTPMDDQGYAAIRRTENPLKIEKFIVRRIKALWGAQGCSSLELQDMAKKPPYSLFDLDRELSEQWWVCGGSTGRSCSSCENPDEGNLLKKEWFLVALAAASVVLCITCVVTCFYARTLPEESEEWAKRHLSKGGYRYADGVSSQRSTRSINISGQVLSPSTPKTALVAHAVAPQTNFRVMQQVQGSMPYSQFAPAQRV